MSQVEPTLPLKRLQAISQLASPQRVKKFEPSSTHLALAGALLKSPPAPNLAKLAEYAGISTDTLSTILENETAVAWILNRAGMHARAGLGAVYLRMWTEAVENKNPKWAELFLTRFDPEFRAKTDTLNFQDNRSVNVFAQMSTSELQAFIRAKRQKVMGDKEESCPTT